MDADWGAEEEAEHIRVQLSPQNLQDPMARPCVEPEGPGDGGYELCYLSDPTPTAANLRSRIAFSTY